MPHEWAQREEAGRAIATANSVELGDQRAGVDLGAAAELASVDQGPVACTGPLSGDELDDEVTDEDDDGEPMFQVSAARRPGMEDVLCQMLANQTRMVEATLGQMGTVIAGVARRSEDST